MSASPAGVLSATYFPRAPPSPPPHPGALTVRPPAPPAAALVSTAAHVDLAALDVS